MSSSAFVSGGQIPTAKDPKTGQDRPTMHIKVYSPFTVYYNDEGYSLSAINTTGPFDILPHHHNFMTLLNPCELIISTRIGVQKIRIGRGVMHVKADQVIVFLDV